MLLAGDRALLCDFGLARAIDRAALEPLSSSGWVIGTPAYMSPEQAMGEETVGPPSDIYALGCVLYEMLTAELPFIGATPQSIIVRQINDQPRSIRTVRPDLSREIEVALLAALAKEPAARPTSAAELVKRLASERRRNRHWHQTGASLDDSSSRSSMTFSAASARPFHVSGALIFSLSIIRRTDSSGAMWSAKG